MEVANERLGVPEVLPGEVAEDTPFVAQATEREEQDGRVLREHRAQCQAPDAHLAWEGKEVAEEDVQQVAGDAHAHDELHPLYADEPAIIHVE